MTRIFIMIFLILFSHRPSARSPCEKSLKQMDKKSRQYSLLRRIIHADMTRTAVKNTPEA